VFLLHCGVFVGALGSCHRKVWRQWEGLLVSRLVVDVVVELVCDQSRSESVGWGSIWVCGIMVSGCFCCCCKLSSVLRLVVFGTVIQFNRVSWVGDQCLWVSLGNNWELVDWSLSCWYRFSCVVFNWSDDVEVIDQSNSESASKGAIYFVPCPCWLRDGMALS